MKKIILFLLLFPVIGYSQYTSIPDQNFEQALIDLGYDNIIDGQVFSPLISSMTSLDIDGLNISDLTGIEEFTKKIVLENEEIENLFFGGMALTFMQSVRFLTDYLNGDSYYKTSYKDQNLMRTKNQWALYKSLKN
jgi:hypothetical protein